MIYLFYYAMSFAGKQIRDAVVNEFPVQLRLFPIAGLLRDLRIEASEVVVEERTPWTAKTALLICKCGVIT